MDLLLHTDSTGQQNYCTTLADVGLRSKDGVLPHTILDNTFEDNLVPNIAKVDYLANHSGETHLQPLEGLPPFVDDLYVFGYMGKKDMVEYRGKVLCTTGQEGTAKNIVAKIVVSARECFGSTHRIHTNLLHCVALSRKEGSSIRNTIATIENQTEGKARKVFVEQEGEEPEGAFVAKVDVSELAIEEIQEGIPKLEKKLAGQGLGIYSIDYTQDFSGTLDRKKLVQFLRKERGFAKQGTLAQAMGSREATILDNTAGVGNHVCTWVSTRDGYTIRTKIYNKIVSNFEAGDVQNKISSHLANYVDCPNKHLQKTFAHPDVQKRGCSRIEVSVYACQEEIFSTKTAKDFVEEVLELVSPPEQKLFVVQSPKMHWKNLSSVLDRCFVVAARPLGKIYVAWYAHTTTKRISGILVAPPKKVVETDSKWENAVQWAMADFGFRACPIFRTDLVSIEPNNIEMLPLRCYAKGKESKTILAPSKQPHKILYSVEDPSTFLPDTEHVAWKWRTKKTHEIGSTTSEFSLQEVPTDRTISLLSKAQREQKMLEIEDAIAGSHWLEYANSLHEELVEQRRKIQKEKKEEIAKFQKVVEAREQYLDRCAQSKAYVEESLGTRTIFKIGELETGRYRVLGFAKAATNPWNPVGMRVVLGNKSGETSVAWCNTKLARLLQEIHIHFQHSRNKNDRDLYILPDVLDKQMDIEIHEKKSFLADKKQIVYNPISVLATPDPDNIQYYQDIVSMDIPDYVFQEEMLEYVEPPKQCKKAMDMDEGDYLCKAFSETIYRGNTRTILFLYAMDTEGKGIGEPTPVYGHFLEEAISRIDLDNTTNPLLCRLGRPKTTPNKKKDRIVHILAN